MSELFNLGLPKWPGLLSGAKYTLPGPRPDDGDFYSIDCPECKQTVTVYPD